MGAADRGAGEQAQSCGSRAPSPIPESLQYTEPGFLSSHHNLQRQAEFIESERARQTL